MDIEKYCIISLMVVFEFLIQYGYSSGIKMFKNDTVSILMDQCCLPEGKSSKRLGLGGKSL